MELRAAKVLCSKQPSFVLRVKKNAKKMSFTLACFSSHRVVGMEWSLIDKLQPRRPTVKTGPLMIR